MKKRDLPYVVEPMQTRDIQEAMELQASFAKTAFDTCMKQFGEMASLYASTMKEASAPLNAHAGTMVEKLQFVK